MSVLKVTYLWNMIQKFHIWGCSIQNAKVIIKFSELCFDEKIMFCRSQIYSCQGWNISELSWNVSFFYWKENLALFTLWRHKLKEVAHPLVRYFFQIACSLFGKPKSAMKNSCLKITVKLPRLKTENHPRLWCKIQWRPCCARSPIIRNRNSTTIWEEPASDFFLF